jgi:DNA uptake protein ComE-like DNA-binding protein
MRGGKSLADRGMIPRLLSGIYRRSRKIEKDSKGETSVEVSMSYYEIYNDKVYDLFEPPESRSLAGLPLRDNGGKTVVVGLTERPCESLKEFERLYDAANVNRSTGATKLNAHSSRSHAVLCVKLVVTTGDECRTSTASAIDLAGSEDNRRTDNGKERLVESASINKSLFVLAQCVEAISKKQSRIPYRESKMTRILSLGQNNGLTVMILNLAPVRSYHLDTLSSLNFANRTKKIEVREVENEPIFKGCARPLPTLPSVLGPSMQRQPLRPLASAAHNALVRPTDLASKPRSKPAKTFSVYVEKSRHSGHALQKRSSPAKRPSDTYASNPSRPTKMARYNQPSITKATIEDLVEKKVSEILAARALNQTSTATVPVMNEEVQRRLQELEKKIDETKDDSRAEGLSYILMGKQHQIREEYSSALKMYELAREYFPDNAKLEARIEKVRDKLREHRKPEHSEKEEIMEYIAPVERPLNKKPAKSRQVEYKDDENDESNFQEPDAVEDSGYESDGFFKHKSKAPKRRTKTPNTSFDDDGPQTPRSKQLLDIINTRDLSQIRLLKGVGAKKAEGIITALEADEGAILQSLGQLSRLKGVGAKTVENMRAGLTA